MSPGRIWIPVLDFDRTGGHRVLAELATQWVRLGRSVTFVVNARSGRPYFGTEGDILWVDDEGWELRGPQSLHPAHGGGRVWHVLRSLYRALELRVADGDVMLANHSLTAWPVWSVRSQSVRAYYVQAYEPEYFGLRNPRRWLLWLLSSGSYLLPLRRIVNSPIYLRYKLLRADVWVPPGLDFAKFYAVERVADWPPSPIVLGCIGRHEPEKGTRYVLDAQTELSRRGVDAELKIAFGNLPRGTELPPRTHVVVPNNDTQLGDFYRSVDFIIAPGTLQHGAPHYPVMEGMACGAGVITTGYMPATPESAWIVPVGDAKAIADAVETALDMPEEYLRRIANGAAAVKEFAWPTVARELLNAL